MNVERMVLLDEYENISQAEMAKQFLDDAGVWSMINNEYMSTIYPTGVVAQLIVIENDFNRAKALLDDQFSPIIDVEVAEMSI